jgi:FkbM family methyltransferase
MRKNKNFNFKLFSRVLITTSHFFPYSVRVAISRIPLLRSLIGKFLNFFIPPLITVVEITAGPLKGFRLEVHLRKDRWHWLGVHEPEVFSAFQKIVTNGMTAYDVGAALGSHSLLLARLCGPEGRVFAFEPDIYWFSRLIRNLELNSIKNVKPLQLAVSEVSGRVFLGRPSKNDFWRLIKEKKEGWEVIEISSIALDDFCLSNPAPELLKIDVEGGETRVLLGAKRILSQHRPIIICELHGPDLAFQVLEILQKYDYLNFYLENNCLEINSENVSFIPISHYIFHIFACPKEKLSIIQKVGLIKKCK